MADLKVTQLTELAEVPASSDLLMVVDVSDTTMSAAGTNKKLSAAYVGRTGGAVLYAQDSKALTLPASGTAALLGADGAATRVPYFSDTNTIAGDAGMTFDAANNRLTVSGGFIAPSLRPASNSTTAVQVQNSSGSAIITVDTINNYVGIGSTPEAKLHVSAGDSGVSFANVTGLAIENSGASGSFFVFRAATGGDADAFCITNAGYVGIGKSDPAYSLDVDGVTRTSGIIMVDATNIALSTTTGTKIGTAANQKLAFYNATPIVQQTGVAVSAAGIHAALVNLGLITA